MSPRLFGSTVAQRAVGGEKRNWSGLARRRGARLRAQEVVGRSYQRSVKGPGVQVETAAAKSSGRFFRVGPFLQVGGQFVEVGPAGQIEADHFVAAQRRPATGPQLNEQTGNDRAVRLNLNARGVLADQMATAQHVFEEAEEQF